MKIKLKRKEEKHEDTFDPIRALEINKYKLDEEATYQPLLMAKITRLYAQKYKLRYEKEIELGIVKDQLAEDMKTNPHKWELEKGDKITDALVNRIVVRNTRYQRVYKEYIDAKAEEKEWEGLIKACEQRAWSLKSLENLYEKNYYANK